MKQKRNHTIEMRQIQRMIQSNLEKQTRLRHRNMELDKINNALQHKINSILSRLK
jgi:hypothetical protein